MLWIIKIAWKNIWRNPSRTFISMASVFFAVVLSTLSGSLKEGIFNNLVNNVVSFYSGYIQIHGKGYWDEQSLDKSFEEEASIPKILRHERNITAFTPRLASFALVASEKTTKGCLVVGIDPDSEQETTQIQNKLVEGQYLNKDDEAVMCTAGLAKRLSLQTGDTI
ncbi:MAG: ABC transporter permease, partial [Bacteroidota bacterium]